MPSPKDESLQANEDRLEEVHLDCFVVAEGGASSSCSSAMRVPSLAEMSRWDMDT